MSTSTRRSAGAALLAGLSLALVSACGSGDPLAAPSEEGESGGTVVVGSQAYYSNAIIAEIYAQTLENAGYTVQRQFQIGQRDAYLQAMESGEVDLLPEYSGNLLQFYAPDTTARSPEEVAGALPEVLPDGLSILDYAEAQDADSYNVTAEFSKKNDITSLADLADYDGTITIGGNAELKSRPYGLQGLKEFYDVDADFVAIGDSGGPLTKDAIRDGTITMGDIYTADPALAGGDFVTLKDPENMILAQNVLPLVNADLAEELADVLNPISAKLTTQELIQMNDASVNDKKDAAAIAEKWLSDQGLV
ncbi:MAG TPA: ABC transporter substrate-binding protein [Ruania sp.]|nr:ABC transporter substrate-binding protein [Ruania sp.]